MGSTVALKVLPRQLAGQPELRERFEREARAVAALNHPHICALHDVGNLDGIDYVVKFLEGDTLADRLKQAGAKRLVFRVVEVQAHKRGRARGYPVSKDGWRFLVSQSAEESSMSPST